MLLAIITMVLVLILIAGLIYLFSLDGKFQVKRSLEIAQPRDTVFATIANFKTWPKWSPWLIHETDAIVDFSDNHQEEGGSYRWEGQIIGAGKLLHRKLTPASQIKQQLELLKPFKAVNLVNWEFEARDKNSLVSWEVSGRMPFLLRFMTQKIENTLANDTELGLALLNGYLCPDAPYPVFDFNGTEVLQDFIYWSIPCSGNQRQLESARRKNIETLRTAAGGSTALALSLYYHFDPLASHFQAETAIPMGDPAPASNYTRREFHRGRYYKMTLRGGLQFLPLGWHALSSHCRLHKVKYDRSRPALEIYLHDPETLADENQMVSMLYLPVR